MYFMEGVRGNAREHLQEFGLTHIDDPAAKLHQRDVVSAVDGKSGLIVGCALSFPEVQQLRFEPSQEWIPFPTAHAARQAKVCQVGTPGPSDLQRSDVLDSRGIQLSDGNTWLIPIAHKADENFGHCNLPLACDLTDDGKLAFNKVARKYRPLWGHVESYLRAFEESSEEADAEGNIGFTYRVDMESFCRDVIGANYRVDLRELTMLELIDSNNMVSRLMSVLMDDEGYAILKKNADQGTGNG